MRRLPFFIAFLCCIACSKALTPEEQASMAAEGFYHHLIAGEYEQFLQGRAGADSLPAAYREQLLVGYKQFMAQQQTAHKGIQRVSVSNAKTDSISGDISVFLMLCYGDSTQEETVVPMVDYNGSWRMK